MFYLNIYWLSISSASVPYVYYSEYSDRFIEVNSSLVYTVQIVLDTAWFSCKFRDKVSHSGI